MSLLGTWSGFVQGNSTTLTLYANQTYLFRDVIGNWQESAGKLVLSSDKSTSIYNYATSLLAGKETLTLIYEGSRFDEAVILTKEILINNDNNIKAPAGQYSQNFVNFLQQMHSLGSLSAPSSTTSNIFLPTTIPTTMSAIPVVNSNNSSGGGGSSKAHQQSYTKIRWGVTFDVPDNWFAVEKKALNSIMVASPAEPGLVMVRFMPAMNVEQFQQMYTLGFDENGVPLLPTTPLSYFSPLGENCATAVAGEMQGISSDPVLLCRVIGLITSFGDCCIVCGVTKDNFPGLKQVTDKVAASMRFKIRSALLYS